MLIISIDGNRSRSDYPDASEIITKAELESMADMFDYSIQPREVDRAVVEEKLAEAEAAYQAEHTYVPEVYSSINEYLMNNVLKTKHQTDSNWIHIPTGCVSNRKGLSHGLKTVHRTVFASAYAAAALSSPF